MWLDPEFEMECSQKTIVQCQNTIVRLWIIRGMYTVLMYLLVLWLFAEMGEFSYQGTAWNLAEYRR